jgi:ABC-2 type transport system ATP-binding protein
MNLIAGYLRPSDGQIKIMGKDIVQHPVFAKQNIGFMAEGAPLYQEITVQKFLCYMAELRGFSGFEKQKEIDRVAKITKIENILNQPTETLSKGYGRRVGFAQSILSDSSILLLDEPTDGLDPNQKEHIINIIKKMGEDKTILISTHNLEECQEICNRIIVLHKGKKLADGTLTQILNTTKTTSLKQAFKTLTQRGN